MALDSLVEYAEEMFDHGLLCIPVTTGGRHIDFSALQLSAPHLTTRSSRLKEMVFTATLYGFTTGRVSRDSLKTWFSGHDGNVGVVCGYRDVVVLDFDRAHVFERFRNEHQPLLSATPIAKSPHGFHVYLRCSRPYASSSLYFQGGKGGHLKALGGYVLASPSRIGAGEKYEWLPGQSPLDIEIQTISRLEDYSLRQSSPLKRLHDRIRRRGSFVPD
jgi:hypothetical protein